MKAKVKLDKDSLITFFSENGEKLVFGIAILLFFVFVWSAVTAERYDKTPEDLEQAATQARNHLQTVSSEITDVEIPNYRKKIEEINKPIPASSYASTKPWVRTIFPPLRKRGQPTLEKVEDLLAISGHGRFSNTGAAGAGDLVDNDRPDGRRWVLLTGLLNMEKIRKSYKETFEDVHPRLPTDIPQFYSNFCSFYVERAEITDDPENLKWEPIYSDIKQYLQQYVGNQISTPSQQSEKTDPTAIEPSLIVPLPQRTDRQWGEEVLHAPEIPLMDMTAQHGMGMPGMVTPIQPGVTNPGGMTPPGETPPEGLPPGIGNDTPNTPTDQVEQKISPYVLFRFFDFNVEPGKKYRYHVRLYFKNPNYEIKNDSHLDPALVKLKHDPEKKWSNYIATEWSEPSNTVHMPLDDDLLLASVNPPKPADSEPTANVTLVHWDYMKGFEILDEVEGVHRGKVVNYYDRDMPTPEVPGPPNPMPGETSNQPEKVSYVTGLLVLDLKGGETLPSRTISLHKPSSMLLFSPSGALIVRSSVEDEEESKKLKGEVQPGMPGYRPHGGYMPVGPMPPGMMDQ
ncbi:MAG: hypothetical protein PVH19_02735 [Planctomycetia bacterium]|jgi:hypothetical protein